MRRIRVLGASWFCLSWLVEQGQDDADGCDGQDVEGADVDFAVHDFAFRVSSRCRG